MVLEDCALEILDCIGLSVGVAYFLHLFRDRVALLGKRTIGVPVGEEPALDCLARFWEGAGVALRQRW